MGRSALLLAGLLALGMAGAPAPEIRLDDDPESPGFGTFSVVGLEDDVLERLRRSGDDVFAVYTGDTAPAPGKPAMLGSVTALDGRLRFTPRFPLVPGQPYFARFRDPGGGLVEASFALPRPELEPKATVAAVYPSADELPENLLKVYLRFSAPMSRGEAVRHLRLVDADGDEVPFPFVAPEHELWNPPTDRLTVFLDPGRIKRGVGPNLELGPPIVEGETYRLVVDREWRDARGAPLVAGFEKSFRVVAPDRTSPRVDDWRLTPPGGPEAPLAVDFPEPLDHALLERLLVVVDGAGAAVAGTLEVGDGERRVTFRPRSPWRPGPYELRVGTELEDLAGNSLLRPFETAVLAAPGKDGPVVASLPFAVLESAPTKR